MTQFHEGQEVEVRTVEARENPNGFYVTWRKAKIVNVDQHGDGYVQVQFPDGTRGVFDAEHVRAVKFDLQKEWRNAGALGD